tara:strand:- start:1401 stop:2663 length:1263 start_codon:yes stop_codon:yes gene_type:complete
MKKIVLLLTLMMMLAGCTDLAEDSTDSGVLTAQDLDGLYMSVMFGLEVEMNSDDTFVISELELYDCYETKADADAGAAEILDDEMFAEEYDEATVAVSDNCVYIKTSLGYDDDGTTFAATLITQAAVPYIEMVVTSTDFEGEFTCDDGETIPADWVNDGEEDCDGGEDEDENAGDSLESESMEIATVYLAADGHGSLVYAEGVMEEDTTFCLPLGPSSVMPIFYQAVDVLEELSDEEMEELEWDDESTYPTQLSDLISTVNQNYADSSIPGLTDSLCGGFTSMMATWFDWGGNLAEGSSDGGLALYDFAAYDASDETPTSSSGEDLVYLQMIQGNDLSWSSIGIQISVDGGASQLCTNPGQATDTACAISDNDDGMFALGEDITIMEGTDDLCSASCEIEITVIDMNEGKVLYQGYISVE